MRIRLSLAALALAATCLAAQNRYALFLEGQPLARAGGRAVAAKIAAAQQGLRLQLERSHFAVTGSVGTLLNAVFVQAPPEKEAELRALPGVVRVVKLRRFYRRLDRAVQLTNIPAAWNMLGGTQNAGAGVKIAVIDSGIDQNHPGFQDASLSPPAGFPKCDEDSCAYTNNKVIVARSYVRQLAAGSQPNPSVDSRPDDYSARDHSGHGTAVAMAAAGVTNTGPSDTITGVAPKAFLGSYKVFGTPGVIDFSSGDVIIMALEDALRDGMNVAVLSLGAPAFTGALDMGAVCGADPGEPCDPEATAAENAVQQGMMVVTAGGNEGDYGMVLPTLGTADSPGTAPSALSVGGTTNSHRFINQLSVTGAGSNLRMEATFGDGPMPAGPDIAPIRDVTSVGDTGLACSPMPPASLNGFFALAQRGTCTFLSKVTNVQAAGAIGLILYNSNQPLAPPGGLTDTQIPTVIISNADGQNLKNLLAGSATMTGTLDPTLVAVDQTPYNTVAFFSSRGPATGSYLIKPDLVATATDLYLAAEKYDPNGELYSPGGYTVSQGTSFSAPIAAGAVALVKQKNPGFRATQLKSAVVNTATQDVTDESGTAPVTAIGGGKLNGGDAVNTNVTVEPATLSFGALTAVGINRPLQITNTGSSAVNLRLSFDIRTPDARGTLSVDRTGFSLAPGTSTSVTVTLGGRLPAPGSYQGALVIQGGAVSLRVPYLYQVGDGVPFNAYALTGDGFDGTVGQDLVEPLVLRIVDQYGVAVAGLPVRFRLIEGDAGIKDADSATDVNGLAGAFATMGSTPGDAAFRATAGGLPVDFTGFSRLLPVVAPNGAVNAASFQIGPGVAPGSYITLFGSGLSDIEQAAKTAILPLSIGSASVSFDVPSAGLSLPGRVYFVSPGQVNVQVPWELRGQKSARIKVTIMDTAGQVYNLPLSDYSPAIFEYGSGASRFAAALDENSQVIGSVNPAGRGRSIQLYANGLGPVTNQPATGEPAPAQNLAATTSTPTVTIGGQPAAVSFSGLAPGYSALYQVNVTVPAGIGTGPQPVILSIGGVSAKTTQIVVQ